MVDLIDPTTDLLVRTIYGEAANQPPEGWQRIAATAYNRAARDGVSVSKQLLAPNQYQAWQNPKLKASMLNLAQSDPKYQAILASVQPIASGHISFPDINYLNRATTPKNSSALNIIPGRPDSGWGINPGTKVGDHEFYGPKDAEDPDMVAAMGGIPALPEQNTIEDADFAAAMGETGLDPEITEQGTHNILGNKLQQETLRRYQTIGDIVTDKATGMSTFKGIPIRAPANQEEIEKGVPENTYYVEPEKGTLQYKGPKEGDVLTGLGQGAADIGLTMSRALPPSEVGQRLRVLQEQYDAKNKGNIASDLGRFGGQVAATAPILGGAGALGGLTARSAPALAPTMEFLGGAAGKAAPGIARNATLRGASLFTNGALQGGTTTGLTSSTSDQPFWTQVGEGAAIGGFANPILHGIGSSLASKFFPKIAPVRGAVDNKNIVSLARKANNDFDLDMRATQLRGATDPKFSIRDQKLINSPGSGFAANALDQPMKGTHAIGSTFGLKPKDMPYGLTGAIDEQGSVMGKAREKLGNGINAVRAGQSLDQKGVTQLMVDLTNPVANPLSGARAAGLSTDEIGALKDTIRNIKALTRDTGTLTGEQYQTFIGHGSDFDTLQSNPSPGVRRFAGKLREVLDTAMNKGSTPATVQRLNKLLLQYKNMMTVAPLVSQHPNGIIPISELQNVVNNKFEMRPFAGKQTPLEDLAQIGQTFPNYGAIPEKNKLTWKNIVNSSGGLGAGIGLLGERMFNNGGWQPAAVAGLIGGAAGLTVGRRVANATSGALNDNRFLRDALLNNKGYNPGNIEQFLTNNVPVPATTLPVSNAFRQKQKGKK